MNTQYFYWQNGHELTDEEIEAQNAARKERGIRLGIGWFEVDAEEVRYHYSENDSGDYLVASLVGAARDGNDFDSFVLMADHGTVLVTYIYGIDALDYTEDKLCQAFHIAVENSR